MTLPILRVPFSCTFGKERPVDERIPNTEEERAIEGLPSVPVIVRDEGKINFYNDIDQEPGYRRVNRPGRGPLLLGCISEVSKYRFEACTAANGFACDRVVSYVLICLKYISEKDVENRIKHCHDKRSPQGQRKGYLINGTRNSQSPRNSELNAFIKTQIDFEALFCEIKNSRLSLSIRPSLKNKDQEVLTLLRKPSSKNAYDTVGEFRLVATMEIAISSRVNQRWMMAKSQLLRYMEYILCHSKEDLSELRKKLVVVYNEFYEPIRREGGVFDFISNTPFCTFPKITLDTGPRDVKNENPQASS